MLGQALRAARLNLFRRGMSNNGRLEEGNHISTLHMVGALSCISVSLLGPGILLMFYRDKPEQEH